MVGIFRSVWAAAGDTVMSHTTSAIAVTVQVFTMVNVWARRGLDIDEPESDWGQTGVRPGSDRGQTGVRLGSDRGQTGVRLESDSSLTPVDLLTVIAYAGGLGLFDRDD